MLSLQSLSCLGLLTAVEWMKMSAYLSCSWTFAYNRCIHQNCDVLIFLFKRDLKGTAAILQGATQPRGLKTTVKKCPLSMIWYIKMYDEEGTIECASAASRTKRIVLGSCRMRLAASKLGAN